MKKLHYILLYIINFVSMGSLLGTTVDENLIDGTPLMPTDSPEISTAAPQENPSPSGENSFDMIKEGEKTIRQSSQPEQKSQFILILACCGVLFILGLLGYYFKKKQKQKSNSGNNNGTGAPEVVNSGVNMQHTLPSNDSTSYWDAITTWKKLSEAIQNQETFKTHCSNVPAASTKINSLFQTMMGLNKNNNPFTMDQLNQIINDMDSIKQIISSIKFTCPASKNAEQTRTLHIAAITLESESNINTINKFANMTNLTKNDCIVVKNITMSHIIQLQQLTSLNINLATHIIYTTIYDKVLTMKYDTNDYINVLTHFKDNPYMLKCLSYDAIICNIKDLTTQNFLQIFQLMINFTTTIQHTNSHHSSPWQTLINKLYNTMTIQDVITMYKSDTTLTYSKDLLQAIFKNFYGPGKQATELTKDDMTQLSKCMDALYPNDSNEFITQYIHLIKYLYPNNQKETIEIWSHFVNNIKSITLAQLSTILQDIKIQSSIPFPIDQLLNKITINNPNDIITFCNILKTHYESLKEKQLENSSWSLFKFSFTKTDVLKLLLSDNVSMLQKVSLITKQIAEKIQNDIHLDLFLVITAQSWLEFHVDQIMNLIDDGQLASGQANTILNRINNNDNIEYILTSIATKLDFTTVNQQYFGTFLYYIKTIKEPIYNDRLFQLIIHILTSSTKEIQQPLINWSIITKQNMFFPEILKLIIDKHIYKTPMGNHLTVDGNTALNSIISIIPWSDNFNNVFKTIIQQYDTNVKTKTYQNETYQNETISFIVHNLITRFTENMPLQLLETLITHEQIIYQLLQCLIMSNRINISALDGISIDSSTKERILKYLNQIDRSIFYNRKELITKIQELHVVD